MDIKELIDNFNKYGIHDYKPNEIVIFKKNLNKNIRNISKKNNRIESQIIEKKTQLKLSQIIKKHYSDLYEKLFKNKKNNFSLVYKNITGNYYIKARFTWKKKQREIQVGSIRALIEKFKELSLVSDKVALKNIDDNNWDNIKNNSELIKIINNLAHFKILSYMIANTLNNNSDINKKNDSLDYNMSYSKDNHVEKENIDKEKNIDESTINDEWYKSWTMQKD